MVTLTSTVTGKTAKPIDGASGKRLPFNVTIEGTDNVWYGLGQPVVYRSDHISSQAGTDRFYCEQSSNNYGLDEFYAYEGDFWTGATADIYIITNGIRTRLALATVTGGKSDLLKTYLGDNKMVTGTSAEMSHAYMRPNHVHYYRVAAINSSGEIGTYSAFSTFTTPASIPSTGATNTTVTISFSGTSALAAPTGVSISAKAGEAGIAVMTWNSVSGAAGYVIEVNYQNPANNAATRNDQYLDLDTSGLSIPAGANIVLSKRLLKPPTGFCSRVWNVNDKVNGLRPSEALAKFRPQDEIDGIASEWVAYTGGDPAPSGVLAGYYSRNNHQTFGTEQRFTFHAGKYDDFYDKLEVGRKVTFKVLLRSDTPAAGDFTMLLNNCDNVVGDTTFTSTTSWAWYEISSTQTSVRLNASLYDARLTAKTTSKYDIAALFVYTNTLDTNDAPPELVNNFPTGGFVRDHRHIKPDKETNDLEYLVLPAGFGARKKGSPTLHSLLYQCKLHGCNPWIQLEWFHTNQDWEDLVAYLCAPVSSGNSWALKREAAGQTAPWWDEFSEILIEFGNEPWNSLAAFWTARDDMIDTANATRYSRGNHYGMMCQQFIDAMKNSPWYDLLRAKTKFVLGGHSKSNYGEQALPYVPDIDYSSIAGYNGGWEVTDELAGEDGNSFLNALALPESAATFWPDRISEAEAFGKSLIVYEAGPGYQFSGLGGVNLTAEEDVSQEVVLKSRACATGTLHAFLYRASEGFDYDNYFRLQAGDFWTSHARLGVREGEPFLVYGIMELVNDLGYCQAKELTKTTSPVRPQDSIPSTKAYILRSLEDPTVCIVAAININIDVSLLDATDPLYNATPSGTETVVINTPVTSCTGLEYFANVGNFREHNRYPVGERFVPSPAGFEADSLCVSLPASWSTGSALADASQITIDNTYGASASGLQASGCVLIKMTGCQFE